MAKIENFNKLKKKVVQLSMEGEFIQLHDSIKEAHTHVGLKNGDGIRMCCKGQLNKSGGYKWKFEEDYFSE